MSLPTCQPTPAGRTPSGKPAWRHGRDCRQWPLHLIDAAHPWHDDPPENDPISCTEGHRKCSPVFRHAAPGVVVGLYHEDTCAAAPGQRISTKEYGRGRQW